MKEQEPQEETAFWAETAYSRGSGAADEWLAEQGYNLVSLSAMLGREKEQRPFCYEVRFDLWPVGERAGFTVVKGFGEQGGLVAFNEGSGLSGQVANLCARMRSGSLKFRADEYCGGSYQRRYEAWLKSLG